MPNTKFNGKKCLLILGILMMLPVYGQKKTRKSYCGRPVHCSLPAEAAEHKNPYFNEHLCENFNPQQANFSWEYYFLQTNQCRDMKEAFPGLMDLNFIPALLSGPIEQNGVIGLDCERIRIHFDSLRQHTGKPGIYSLYGKSRVKDNICRFGGEIQLLNILHRDCEGANQEKKCGKVLGRYTLWEDSSQYHSGFFQGIFEATVLIDIKEKKIELDQRFEDSDSYANRTFVGIWTSYETKEAEKCIWGDYRLPFVFDFYESERGMQVNERYLKHGWEFKIGGEQTDKKRQEEWWAR